MIFVCLTCPNTFTYSCSPWPSYWRALGVDTIDIKLDKAVEKSLGVSTLSISYLKYEPEVGLVVRLSICKLSIISPWLIKDKVIS